MNTPEIKFLGWDEPAIKLVAEKLLEGLNAPQTAAQYRRATVVVPTAGSGQRLREYMAELSMQKYGKSLLMPRIALAGHLIPTEYPGVATEMETLSAWLQVLSAEDADPVAQYAPLIPRRPDTHRERWAVGVAHKLMGLRIRLTQEEVTLDTVSHQLGKRKAAYQKEADQMSEDASIARAGLLARREVAAKEQVRWSKLQSLFDRVDALLPSGNPIEKAQEDFVKNATWPKQCRLLIMACVPEFSPQIKTLLSNLHGKDGGRVEIWVHAPGSEAYKFDDFGLPKEADWGNREIEIPDALVYADADRNVVDNAASTIHLVTDAEAMAEEALRLAGGKDSRGVVLAVGDSEFSPAIINAFTAASPAWKLNLPEGRNPMTTDLGRLPGLLADACDARENMPLWDTKQQGVRNNDIRGLDTFIALLTNTALQQAIAKAPDALIGMQEHVEKIRMLLLPGSEDALLSMLQTTPQVDDSYKSIEKLKGRQQQAYYDYAVQVHKLIDCLCTRKLPTTLTKLADKLKESHQESPDRKLAASIAGQMQTCAEAAANLPSPLCTLELLRRRVEDAVKGPVFIERNLTTGDLLGWRELAYTSASQVILAAMHDGCIPEPVPEDDFLPESLCNELGIRHEKFRTARDSYLLTALIESRRQSGRVDFILARQKADGSVLAPSGLLMRCGDELPQRARALFAESKTPKVLPRPAECPLRRATGCGKSISPGELEHIGQIAPGKQNPFTRWFQNDEGQLVQKSYSPSSLAGFLQCPLTFWIKNLFHIDLSDTYKENKAELESNEYGSVMHAVLDKLVEQFPSQEKLLTACPEAEHDTQAAERLMMTTARQLAVDEWQSVYNSTSARQSQTLPMEVQLQAIERTLAEFVRQHIKDLAEGWCNIAREYTFKSTLPLADGATVRFSMNADRIDRHKDGRWRIIDYKTSSGEKIPHKVHFDLLDGGADSLYCRFMNVQGYQFGTVSFGTKLYRWNDVQLPLYAYGLRHPSTEDREKLQLGEADMSEIIPDLVYYNLQSKTEKLNCYYLVRDGAVLPITAKAPCGLSTEALFDSAMQTVQSAISMIRAGQCLFSAEALEFTSRPFSALNSGSWGSKTPRFGALSLESDPRSLFSLPRLTK